MRAVALVPAAGLGERLGGATPKGLRLLGGLPLLAHAVSALAAAPSVVQVVVAAPAGHLGRTQSLLVGHHGDAALVVVEGGPTRAESVGAALDAVTADVEAVLVHDAARPLVPPALVERVVAALDAGAEAAVPGLPVADTVKRVDGDDVVETVDRAGLRAVQTPQGFRRGVLERAYARRDWTPQQITDDASLAEHLGVPVVVVAGEPEAFKVTRPFDLLMAEAVLAARAGAAR